MPPADGYDTAAVLIWPVERNRKTGGARRTKTMAKNTQKVGWIGMGRMGYPIAERLLKAGYDVSIWNRTREKAEPLGKLGGKVVDKAADLAGVDVLFSMVSTGKDLEQVYFGKDGALTVKGRVPAVLVDCSTISVEQSAALRKRV
ncbi:MAG: NAD(P)-dependent oxidoreductase, partial [Rhodoplanes sp.]